MSRDSLQAVALHQEGKASCSQALLSVYGKYFGLDEKDAMRIASAFGGGMGGMGKTCGSVTGAFLVLGLTYDQNNPNAKSEVYALVKEFTKRFTARHGSIVCNELLNVDMSTPEGVKTFREQKLLASVCALTDASAAEIIEELLAGRLPERH